MENTNSMGHVFRHPDYYKKLKASNKLVSARTDQLEPEAPSNKPQAPSDKPQAATTNTRDRKQES
jgi:hypothetical protein